MICELPPGSNFSSFIIFIMVVTVTSRQTVIYLKRFKSCKINIQLYFKIKEQKGAIPKVFINMEGLNLRAEASHEPRACWYTALTAAFLEIFNAVLFFIFLLLFFFNTSVQNSLLIPFFLRLLEDRTQCISNETQIVFAKCYKAIQTSLNTV